MPAPTSPARLRRRWWVMPAGLLLAVGFLALSVTPAHGARHEVRIEQYAYGPSTLRVTQGDTVTWTNLDSVEHDVVVTSGPEPIRSPLLSRGESWSHTFTTPGSYSYICSLHPDMRAAVAADPAAAPPPTAAAAPTPTPQSAPSARATPSRPAATPHTPAPSTPAPAAPAPVPTTAPQQATSAPAAATTTTLDPLLLVAGAAVAVVVFCLLLMASRPVPPAPPPDEET